MVSLGMMISGGRQWEGLDFFFQQIAEAVNIDRSVSFITD
jgi:hypothetical protein